MNQARFENPNMLAAALELRVEELELELSESKTSEAILQVETSIKGRAIKHLETLIREYKEDFDTMYAELELTRKQLDEVNNDE